MTSAGYLPPVDTPGLSETEMRLLETLHADPDVAKAALTLGIKVPTVMTKLCAVREKYRDSRNKQRLGRFEMAPSFRPGSMLS